MKTRQRVVNGPGRGAARAPSGARGYTGRRCAHRVRPPLACSLRGPVLVADHGRIGPAVGARHAAEAERDPGADPEDPGQQGEEAGSVALGGEALRAELVAIHDLVAGQADDEATVLERDG